MTLKLKMRSAFPANVRAIDPIVVSKSGGTYTFSLNPNPVVTVNPSVIQLTLTRSDIATHTLALNTLMVSGNSIPGDVGAGAIYTSQGAGPTSPRAIQDLSGVWFQLVPYNGSWNVGWFGAVGDDTTNCTAAFQAAITAALATNVRTIYVPNGTFWFPAASASLDPGLGGLVFIGEGRGSILHFNEGTTATPKHLFLCATAFASTRGNITFEKIRFLGTLSTAVHGSGSVIVAGNAMFLSSFDRVTVRNCFFENINGMGSQVYDGQHFEFVGNRAFNLGANFVWAVNTPDILIDGNFAQQIGDDFFDCGTSDAVDDSRKIFFRTRTIITNNICISGSRILTTNGGRETIVSNNILKFTGGIAHQATGHVSSGDITVENNTIIDTLNFHLNGTLDSLFANGIIIEGPIPVGQTSSNNTIPTRYNTTTTLIEKPWNWYDDGGLYGSAAANTPTLRVLSPTARVKVNGNILARTAKAVANFSTYGLGFAARDGQLFDSAVLESCFEPAGIVIGPNVYNVEILDNIISHTTTGVVMETNANAYGFKNVRIAGNTITDFSVAALDVRGAGGAIGPAHVDAILENNVIDGDPFRRAANSNVNGSYAADTQPSGFLISNATGLAIRHNTIRNVAQVTDLMINPNSNLFDQNLLICAVPTAVGFNTGNKGIGNIPTGFGKWAFKFIDNDPTSATYQQFTQMPLVNSATIPTTGWYPTGWFVWATAPTNTLLGWSRLTTGSAHVLNTDWVVTA